MGNARPLAPLRGSATVGVQCFRSIVDLATITTPTDGRRGEGVGRCFTVGVMDWVVSMFLLGRTPPGHGHIARLPRRRRRRYMYLCLYIRCDGRDVALQSCRVLCSHQSTCTPVGPRRRCRSLINNELRSISEDAAASWRRHNPLIISLR